MDPNDPIDRSWYVPDQVLPTTWVTRSNSNTAGITYLNAFNENERLFITERVVALRNRLLELSQTETIFDLGDEYFLLSPTVLTRMTTELGQIEQVINQAGGV